MARKRKTGKRTASGQLSRAVDALAERNPPNAVVLARRELFSFVHPSKGPEGRQGSIDQDICDGIGQLHALGMLDNSLHDPVLLRDTGRKFAELWWRRYAITAPKVGKYERSDKSGSSYDGETKDDRDFARMDEALTGSVERMAVISLVVDEWWSDDIAPWAQCLINEGLIARKRIPPGVIELPTLNDKELLAALIRGLGLLVEPVQVRRAA